MSADEDYLGGLKKKTKTNARIFRINWASMLKRERFFGYKHPHTRENARRLRQIEKRMLRGAGLDANGALI